MNVKPEFVNLFRSQIKPRVIKLVNVIDIEVCGKFYHYVNSLNIRRQMMADQVKIK